MSKLPKVSVLLFIFVVTSTNRPVLAHHEVTSTPFHPSEADGKAVGGSLITTPTANTLGHGHGALGFVFEHQRFNAIPAGDAHELHEAGRDIHGKNHEEIYNISLSYGVLDQFDLFLVAPLVSRTSIQIEDADQVGRGERAAGIGDLRVGGKYRFWEQDVDAALLLGVKAPTGETSDRDQAGQKFEPEQQPGSGAWDFTAGLAFSRSFRQRLTLGSAFQYTYRGEGAQDRKFGDVFRHDLGLSYALRDLGRYPNGSVALELHSQWALRDHSRTEDRVFDSGGTTILLSPGLVVDLTKHVSAFWSMPIPIYQNLGGEHEELTYEVITGISWRF